MIETIRNSKIAIHTLLTMALFFNAIAPLSVVISEFTSTDETSVESLFGDKILICTPSGYKYISFDEFENSTDGQNNSPQSHCSLCLINTDNADLYLPTSAEIKLAQISAAENNYQTLRQSHKSKELYQNARPRAPPLYL